MQPLGARIPQRAREEVESPAPRFNPTKHDTICREGEDHALKEIIAAQLAAAMKEQYLTKTAMAERMKTSRRQLDRLFDPAVASVTLETLRRAASAVGRTIRLELV